VRVLEPPPRQAALVTLSKHYTSLMSSMTDRVCDGFLLLLGASACQLESVKHLFNEEGFDFIGCWIHNTEISPATVVHLIEQIMRRLCSWH